MTKITCLAYTRLVLMLNASCEDFPEISRIAVPVKRYVKVTTDALREEGDNTETNL